MRQCHEARCCAGAAARARSLDQLVGKARARYQNQESVCALYQEWWLSGKEGGERTAAAEPVERRRQSPVRRGSPRAEERERVSPRVRNCVVCCCLLLFFVVHPLLYRDSVLPRSATVLRPRGHSRAARCVFNSIYIYLSIYLSIYLYIT